MDRDSLTYPFEERGLQFGDGIYEVVRVYQGEFHLLFEHVERLFRSAEAIKIHLPFDKQQTMEYLLDLLKVNDVSEDAKVYLQVTRGSAARDHVFPEVNANLYTYVQKLSRPIANLKNGVSVITLPDVRWQNCYIKSLNLLPNVLAKQEAKELGCFEAILHRDGLVTECSASNVYMAKDGAIYTHPETNHILHGCVRLKLKDLANQLGIPFIQEAFTVEQLHNADEIFLSSSTAEVMPIVKIDRKTVETGEPGKITTQLQKAFESDINIKDSLFTAQI